MEGSEDKRFHVESNGGTLKVVNSIRRNWSDMFFHCIFIIVILFSWPGYREMSIKPLLAFINGGSQLLWYDWLVLAGWGAVFFLVPIFLREALYCYKGVEEVVVSNGVLRVRRSVYGYCFDTTDYPIDSISQLKMLVDSEDRSQLEDYQVDPANKIVDFLNMGGLCFEYKGKTIKLFQGLKISEGTFLLEQLKANHNFREANFSE